MMKLGQRFIRRYFPYVFLFEKTPIDRMRFINQVNEYFDLNYKLDNLNLQKEKQFIDELNLLKPMLIKNMNEISSTMLANYSSITEFNDKLNRIQKNYKEY